MRNLQLLIAFLISFSTHAQKNLSSLLQEMNQETIPYIFVNDLSKLITRPFDSAQGKNNIILLDAREKNEYKVSHLKGAKFVGYNKFNLKKTMKILPNKDAKIIVYCSLGIRSEDIGEQLKKAGYTNVLNLYGGIFEWKNKHYKVYNKKEKETEKVHAFDKNWGKWLKKGTKVYE